MSTSLLEMNHIKKEFDGLQVLKDVSIHVNEGEVVSIIGSSGSGKSTLLRCATLLTLIDDGEVSYMGNKTVWTENGKVCLPNKTKLKEIQSCFGLVFQNFNLFPHYTVMKNITDAPIHVQKRNKCKDIMSAALVVGLAGGIIVILQDGKVIDTILFNLAKGMEGLGQVATVGMMYVIQTLINLVIPSGSAKAALTMPIMAPFSELIGLSKQATVMAFQFGDGFTNLITPTSGVLIAVLGVSRIPYDKWFKWAWKFILVLVILGFLLLIPTVLIPMNGF